MPEEFDDPAWFETYETHMAGWPDIVESHFNHWKNSGFFDDVYMWEFKRVENEEFKTSIREKSDYFSDLIGGIKTTDIVVVVVGGHGNTDFNILSDDIHNEPSFYRDALKPLGPSLAIFWERSCNSWGWSKQDNSISEKLRIIADGYIFIAHEGIHSSFPLGALYEYIYEHNEPIEGLIENGNRLVKYSKYSNAPYNDIEGTYSGEGVIRIKDLFSLTNSEEELYIWYD